MINTAQSVYRKSYIKPPPPGGGLIYSKPTWGGGGGGGLLETVSLFERGVY